MKKISFLCLFFGIIMAVNAQNPDEEIFRTSIQTLASDEFGGRGPLTSYETKAINYIADQFKKFGLQPVNGDSYFQSVPLQSISTRVKNNSLTINGKKGTLTLRSSDDFIIWSQSLKEKVTLAGAGYVFVGFGICAPEYNWNDYEGIDVKGKIVVILVNDPGYYDDGLFCGKNMTYYGRWTYKFEEATRQGAAGALVIHDTAPASYSWSVIRNSWSSKNLNLRSEKPQMSFQGWISNDAAKRLFEKAGVSYDDAVNAAQKKGFKSFPIAAKSTVELYNTIQTGDTYNVAGILPGTDLKDEYIVYSAHWDHLGIGIPVNNDSIYNGAVDNATGVAGLFVIANKFNLLAQRPRRSIMFLSVSVEESVLLGSDYYSQHPLAPLDKTVVNLNMDCYGPSGRTHDVLISAAGDSETDRYVIEAAAAQGRIVKAAPPSTTGLYYRSDHFSFAKVGVPVIIARGGSEMLDPVAEEKKQAEHPPTNTYHQPSDEYQDWWDFSGTLDDIYLFYGIGLRLANESYFPRWKDGIVYKAIREGKTK
ncbi:MAG: M28 family peptidase [Tannerella sp.]|jgi:Zn-dependent M28 family amino/carboxypeptidase|nr:M28 family peptidase [Tannerella sp.]